MKLVFRFRCVILVSLPVTIVNEKKNTIFFFSTFLTTVRVADYNGDHRREQGRGSKGVTTPLKKFNRTMPPLDISYNLNKKNINILDNLNFHVITYSIK